MSIKTRLKKSPMTWARFLGILQTDGCISWSFDKDKAFHPKIIISITGKRPEFINQIADFLKDHGLKVQISNETFTPEGKSERAVNLTIERMDQCQKLINYIDKLNTDPFPISLVDQKKFDYEILKKIFELNKLRKKAKTESEKAAICSQIADLKEVFHQEKVGHKHKDKQEFFNIFRIKNTSYTPGLAETIISDIEDNVRNISDQMVKLSQNFTTIADIPEPLGEFLAGVFNGDGSFQIDLISHVNEDGSPQFANPTDPKRTPWRRPFFEIRPEITLTLKGKSRFGNLIFNIAFNILELPKTKQTSQKNEPTIVDVGDNKDATRLCIRRKGVLKDSVIPFFERFCPSFDRALNRFRIFRVAVNNDELIRNRVERAKYIVKLIYQHSDFGPENRKRTETEYLALIEKEFKYQFNQKSDQKSDQKLN